MFQVNYTRKLTAIMFTDIVGYTKIMRSDEQKAMNLLYYNRKLIEPLIKKHKGQILKEIGDGTLNSFPSAIEAVRCAIKIQEVLSEIPALNLRIGIHIGDVIQERDDIFGDGVNVASRIESLSEPGQICISQVVFESIQSQSDLGAKSIGKHTLKGIEEPQELYTIIFKESTTDSTKPETTVQKKSVHIFNPKLLTSWVGGTFLAIYLLFQAVGFFSKMDVISTENSIAVFPFDNIRNNEEHNWLSDQFSESLTFKLSQSKTFKVIDRLQVIKALQKYEPDQAGFMEVAPLIGKNINASLVLVGSFATVGNDILVTTKLIDAQTGEVTPIVQERYSMDDPLTILEDISNKVFEKLEHLQKRETP